MNLIKSNSKYKNLSPEDNGALWSIMSKLEGTIGVANGNRNGNDADKEKSSVPGQSPERPEDDPESETKLLEHKSGNMMNSDSPQKQPFNSILQQ